MAVLGQSSKILLDTVLEMLGSCHKSRLRECTEIRPENIIKEFLEV